MSRVLVVEDNEDDAFMLQRTMRKADLGPPVFVATDGQMAVDYLSGKVAFSDRSEFPLPNIIFLDLKLPYRGGFEILEWLRSQADLANISVVILSGSDEASDHERAARLGADGYLVKPASVEDVARFASLLNPN
jgi:CheY-like chemotaxis protein